MKFFHKIVLSILIILTLYICFFKLDHSYLENWDEGFYAQVTKEMLQGKDPIVLRWNNWIFLDKLPLNFWLNAISAKIFGLSEFSIRLTSALSGFAVIIIITFLAFRWWGLVPGLFAFSAIALNNLYIWRTRTGNLDALLSLLFLVSYLLIISKDKRRYLYLGIIFGLTYLQKSTIVFLPMGIFAVYEILTNRKKLKQNLKQYLLVFGLFIVIAGSWLVLGWLKAGKSFIVYYLFNVDQGVSHLKLSFFKTDYLSYAYYSLQRRLFYPFVIGIIFLILNIKKPKNLVLLLFSALLVITLSFTERKNNWYLIPVMPFWGLTMGYGVKKMLELTKRFKIQTIFIILILIPFFYISYKTFKVNISSIINMESSIHEVKTALKLKEISRPEQAVIRLDHAYPVTLYYSDRKTFYYVTVDEGLLNSIKDNDVKYLVGKKEMVDEFEKINNRYKYEVINVDDEAIVNLLGPK